jgi:hypothetical protein
VVQARAQGIRAAVADALGHGDAAARSAAGLMAHVLPHAHEPVHEVVCSAHASRAAEPRGAAIAVLDLRPDGTVEFVGVGNVEALAIGNATRPASRAGTIGVALPRFAVDPVRVAPGAALALVSDGLVVRWPAYAAPHLAPLAAPLLLGVIFATAERRVDDATVLVVRRPA